MPNILEFFIVPASVPTLSTTLPYTSSTSNERFWIVRVTINTAKSYLRKTWKQRVVLNDDIVNNVETSEKTVNNEMYEIVSKQEA